MEIIQIKPVVGQNTTFVATVNGDIPAELTVTVNGGSNHFDSINAGTYTIIAEFAGNATHRAKTVSTTIVVDKINSSIVNANANEVYVGQTTQINVTMGENVTGYVNIKIDGTNNYVAVNNKKATLNIALTAGNHSVVVYYDGDSNYNNATPYELNVTVKDKLNPVIDISPNKSKQKK